MKYLIYVFCLSLVTMSYAHADDIRSFQCKAKEGRIEASIRFMAYIDEESGRLLDDGNKFWHNLKHIQLTDSEGTETPSVVYVTDAEEKSEKERYLRYFWNLKNTSGRLLYNDEVENNEASERDVFFSASTQIDMHQSELLLFRDDDYQAGEFRFRVNGGLEYKTKVKCEGPFETVKHQSLKSVALKDIASDAASIQSWSPIANGDTRRHGLRAVKVRLKDQKDMELVRSFLHDDASFGTTDFKVSKVSDDITESVAFGFYDKNDLDNPEDDRPRTPQEFAKSVDELSKLIQKKTKDEGLVLYKGTYSGEGANEMTVRGLFLYDKKTDEAIFISLIHTA